MQRKKTFAELSSLDCEIVSGSGVLSAIGGVAAGATFGTAVGVLTGPHLGVFVGALSAVTLGGVGLLLPTP